jgi:NAD-dependent deacetylase
MTNATQDNQRLSTAHDWLYNANRVLILTGSGVSAESGIPTFRDAGGLWSGFKVEDLASLDGFDRDPCRVWTWYEERRQRARQAIPNAAHRAISAFIARRPGRALVTQNVDDLHQRAARDHGDTAGAGAVIDFHGNLERMRCRRCGGHGEMPLVINASTRDALPRCGRCGKSERKLMRPDIVWFGEAISPDHLRATQALASAADVCLVIGTSLEVYPAADLPGMTLMHGGQVIEVNPRPVIPEHPHLVTLTGTAGKMVPWLLAE